MAKFQKGESGNPSGRPKGSELLDLKALLEKRGEADHNDKDHYTNEFLDYLIDNYKESEKLMMWMGERLFIKPRTDVDITTNGKDLPTPILYVPGDDSSKEDKGN